MAFICSAGLGIPDVEFPQMKIKEVVQNIFAAENKKMERLLGVFDNAEIAKRQFVVNENWFQRSHSFKEKNDLYIKAAQKYSFRAMDDCLTNETFLSESIPYEAVDMLIFVSSTGLATPSMDVHLMNGRPFKESLERMPLWGLGCAGGAIGLSRAFNWITANPEKMALLVCCELCSLTFQKEDATKSNIVGTALFGDGVGSILLLGEKSAYLPRIKANRPKIVNTSSFTQKNSMPVMGWDIGDHGFEVIFSKNIPHLIPSLWKHHLTAFLEETGSDKNEIHSYIVHPGGKKVLEAMEKSLQIPKQKLIKSHEVLRNHGNMSSATVLYVLNEWMKTGIKQSEKSIVSSLGPGFSSELLLLEWNA